MTHIFIDNINSGRLTANFVIAKIIKYKIVIFNKKNPINIIKKLAINIIFFHYQCISQFPKLKLI